VNVITMVLDCPSQVIGLETLHPRTSKQVTPSVRGRAIAQAVSRWLPTAAVRGSKPDLVMWDLWWDKVAMGQVFSEYFGFPCNRRSLHQLLHNHPHISSGECTIGQYGRSAGTYRDLGDLKQRDLRNQNLGDLKKGPKGV
jgi:hypothetical protein